jgi:DNA replication protein DnaC
MTPTCPLGVCDGGGFVVDEATRTATPCRCRPQLVGRRKAGTLSAVIPRKYANVSFERPPVTDIPDGVVRTVRAYLRRLDENLDSGKGVWFAGEVGTGKTTLAMLIAKTAIEAGRTVAIYSMPRLLNEIRRTYDESSESSYLEMLDRLVEIDLLHVDDVGAEKQSPWVLEQLYAIVNARYEAEKSMVITTNLDHVSLGEQIGQRTVSRLIEMCEHIPLSGRDKRPMLENSA